MSQENNIYILNYWWAANYGANLTAYAIHKIIENSLLINNAEYKQKLSENRFTFHHNFEKKYLKTLNIEEIVNNQNDIYIVGSDQVFRPKTNEIIFGDYLLNFAKPSCKKIAFSASFGVNLEQFLIENSQETIDSIKNSLQSFDAISVREKDGVDICQKLFGVNAEWIIDPVFILDSVYYDKLLENATEDYTNKIVSYMINDKLSVYKNEKTCELYGSNKSIENWLNAIKTCKLFITNSFHGVCFAIMFNKPFICIVSSWAGSSRYNSLFEMLGIENQCINSVTEIYEKDCLFKINYEKVNKRIEEERQRGLEFLEKALKSPITYQKEKTEVRIKYLENRICQLEKQNNLCYHLKKYLWEKWLIIYHKYLPMPIKKCISFIWHGIKGKK